MSFRQARRGATVPVACLFAALLLPLDRARAQIDFDTEPGSASAAPIFSKEFLRSSKDVPRGFYKVGDVGADDTRMQTRGTLGRARFLAADGRIWIRYGLNDHLVFRGTAPMLFSNIPDPDTPGQTIDVLDGGLQAVNSGTFALDGYLLFRYEPPAERNGQQIKPLPAATTLELDLRNVLATSGENDGTIRLRAFQELEDALSGQNPHRLDKRATVVRVANSLGVTTTPLTQTATVLLFTQFALGSRVPLGGFEIAADARHVQPDGSPVPNAPTAETLKAFKLNVETSSVTFSGGGGFAFAPAVGGWTLEQVDPETGLCHGEDGRRGTADDVSARAVHPVDFGTRNRTYPAGPARADVLLQPWYLCATVPEDNEQPIPEGDYYLNVDFVRTDRTQPFPPTGGNGGTLQHHPPRRHDGALPLPDHGSATSPAPDDREPQQHWGGLSADVPAGTGRHGGSGLGRGPGGSGRHDFQAAGSDHPQWRRVGIRDPQDRFEPPDGRHRNDHREPWGPVDGYHRVPLGEAGRLVDREVARKDQRCLEMALKIAHFPTLRELADFDFKAQPSVDKRQIRELATSLRVAHGDHTALLPGPPGPGSWCPPRYVIDDPVPSGSDRLFAGADCSESAHQGCQPGPPG